MLYIYGDSFSTSMPLQRMEIEDYQNKWWGAILAKNLREELKIRALPGTSNYDILRWISEDLKKFTSKDTLVVGLSHSYRFLVPSSIIEKQRLKRIQHLDTTPDVESFDIQGYHIGSLASKTSGTSIPKQVFNILYDMTYKVVQPHQEEYDKYWIRVISNILSFIQTSVQCRVIMWDHTFWKHYPNIKQELNGNHYDDIHWGKIGNSKFPLEIEKALNEKVFHFTSENLTKTIV